MDCPCDYHGSFFEMGSVVYEECNNWLVIFLITLWTKSFNDHRPSSRPISVRSGINLINTHCFCIQKWLFYVCFAIKEKINYWDTNVEEEKMTNIAENTIIFSAVFQFELSLKNKNNLEFKILTGELLCLCLLFLFSHLIIKTLT